MTATMEQATGTAKRLLDYTKISAFGGHPQDFYDGVHITFDNARRLLRKAIKTAPECFR